MLFLYNFGCMDDKVEELEAYWPILSSRKQQTQPSALNIATATESVLENIDSEIKIHQKKKIPQGKIPENLL